MTKQTFTERHPVWVYVIVSVITSIGALIIHSQFNNGIDWNVYFIWLPVVWLMVLVLALLFNIFMSRAKKINIAQAV